MTDKTKITCPVCGSAMNHHAVKVEYDTEESADSVFEGALKNVYACPKCGAVEMTNAQ